MATFGTFSIEHPSGGTMGTADKDYFLDDQGNVTTDEAEAATLLIRKGQEIPKDMADKYDLSGKVARQASKAEADESDEESADEKAAAKPANKMAKSSKNKGAK